MGVQVGASVAVGDGVPVGIGVGVALEQASRATTATRMAQQESFRMIDLLS